MGKQGERGPSAGLGQEKLNLLHNLSYYHILGVSPGAGWKEVQRRYRVLVRKYHPDHNPNDPDAAAHFRLVVEAYQAFSQALTRTHPLDRKTEAAPTGIQEERPPSPPDGYKDRSSEAALNSLRQTIIKSPEFPAFAANVHELLTIKENPYNTVNAVSQIILRDLSLTTQILKLINTTFFQTYQRQMHTISSAVMILGLDRIRDLAIGLRLFENFKKSSRTFTPVMKLIVLSFLTAIQAQELMGQDSSLKPEEVFIIALFFNIGELIAAFYLPDRYEEILMLTKGERLSKKAAAQRVFQVSLEDLGLAVLQEWNLPQGMMQSLSALHEAGTPASPGEARLRKVVKIAYNLSKNVIDPEVTPEVRQKQKESVCRALGLKQAVLDQSLAAGKKRLQEMAQVLKIDLRKMKLAEEIPPPEQQTESPLKIEAKEQETPAGHPQESLKVPAYPKTGLEEAEDSKRLRFLYQVLEEVSQAIVSKAPISQILLMILEGIFRGIGFDRVVFSLVNPKRTFINARFGLGEGIEELFPLMRAPLQSKTHVFSLALTKEQDHLIDLEAEPRDRLLMDEDFWRASGVRSFLISPIVVEGKSIGAVYVDRNRSRHPITDTDRLRMRIFRDQIIIAIRLSSGRL